MTAFEDGKERYTGKQLLELSWEKTNKMFPHLKK
jgi:hypothetical protein